jgi:CheY-like chemotaxis protein
VRDSSGRRPRNELYFYRCPECGQAVDERDLGQVLHHEESSHFKLMGWMTPSRCREPNGFPPRLLCARAGARGVEDGPMTPEHARAILIVDDDAAVLETAVMLVESLGYRAEAASNGSGALERVMADGYDAVLTDVVMPGMDGFQLAKRIQAIRPDLPVICVTGHADVADDPSYCFVVLQKPYGTATLARMLARVLPPETRA